MGVCLGLLVLFDCRWRFCTSAVMIRCMVEARNISASWMRVMTALVIEWMDFVVLGNIGARVCLISGFVEVRW